MFYNIFIYYAFIALYNIIVLHLYSIITDNELPF